MSSAVRTDDMSQTPYQPVFTNTNPYAAQSEAARDTQYYTPETEHLQLHDDGLPAGAAQPRFMGHASRENRASFASSNPTLAGDEASSSSYALNKPGFYGLNYNDSDLNAPRPKESYEPYPSQGRAYGSPKGGSSRKKAIIIGSVVALLVIAGAVVAVYFTVIKPKSDKNGTSSAAAGANGSGSSSAGSSGNGAGSALAVQTGSDGSTVTMEDGTTFTYKNLFGGYWYVDPANPLSGSGQAQSWTPPLNETFKFGEDPIRGWVIVLMGAITRMLNCDV